MNLTGDCNLDELLDLALGTDCDMGPVKEHQKQYQTEIEEEQRLEPSSPRLADKVACQVHGCTSVT